MKKIFYLFLLSVLFMSCDHKKSMTSLFKPEKILKFDFGDHEFINGISFLFVVDNSGSMEDFNKALSQNIEDFLGPIFRFYPNYVYNFAITSTTPESNYNDHLPLFTISKESAFLHCGKDLSSLKKDSNLGSYFNYLNYSSDISFSQLACFVGRSIQSFESIGTGSGQESYFQSLSYIMENASDEFRKDFFSSSRILVLFFISDAWEGVDFKPLSKITSRLEAASVLSDKYIAEFNQVMGGKTTNVRPYAAVTLAENKDKCGEESNPKADEYPFHIYDFINKLGGLKVSICDPEWGKNLTKIADNFLTALTGSSLYLEDVPYLSSLKVFLDDIEIPNDPQTGWTLNRDKLAIEMGPGFEMSYYLSRTKDWDGEIKKDSGFYIKYLPLNIDILNEPDDEIH